VEEDAGVPAGGVAGGGGQEEEEEVGQEHRCCYGLLDSISLSSSPATIFQESSLSWSTSSFQEWSIERFCRLGLVFVPVQGLVINQSVVAVSVCNQLTLRFSMLLYYSRIETSKLRAIAFVLLVLTL
jgi:hypothetical protein